MLFISTILALFVGVALSSDQQRRHEHIYRRAITRSGQTIQQAAAEAEISQPQFTRQLQGLEGTLKRLHMQPVAFWQWYALELLNEFGLPKEVENANRVQRMVRGAGADERCA
jgi:hypothetical protein